MASAFILSVRLDNVTVVTIDMPGEKMDALKAEFASQVRVILKQIHDNKALRGVVFISAKPDSFIAGAGINMIGSCRNAQETEALARQGQQMMAEINTLPVPVTVTIHDACLDGGLEIALACHNRICTDDVRTVLGLLEVQLGLLPGSGGTQRLPRLTGVSTALDMILTGKQLRVKQALKVGLVDEVVPHPILLEAVIELTKKDNSAYRTLPVRERVLAGPLGRVLLFHMTSKRTVQKTQSNHPTTERVLEIIETELAQGSSSGYDTETSVSDELAMTPQSQALWHIFFANTDAKRDPGSDAGPGPLNSVGVLGGDLMGGGITYVMAYEGGLPVRIKDIDAKGINRALKYSWDQLETKTRRRHIKASGHGKQLALISGTIDYRGLAHHDLIIEAVFRDLSLKQGMVAEVEQNCAPHIIFASNTSFLPISDIAANTAGPEQVIGLRFFSPVGKMPLVEVIPHATASEQAVATTVKLAKKQGKTPIVIRDKTGSYVNRVLASYINEAIRMLTEDERVETIDAALVKSGFPVGPIQLLGEVGIDTGIKIIPMLKAAYEERFSVHVNVITSILNDDRKGRKNGRGFYLYGTKGRKSERQVDPAVYTLIGVQGQGRLSAAQVAERCVMLVPSEAAHYFGEKIVRSARDGDIGAVFGVSFPPFLGGPFRYMDSLGVGEVATVLRRLTTQYGSQFTPCEQSLQMAEHSERLWNTGETDLNS